MIAAETGFARCYGGADVDWTQEILRRAPSLSAGCSPPRWARSPHLQNLLTTLHDQRAPEVRWGAEERLCAPDGGTTSVQWLGLGQPPGTPVIVVAHSICGSGDSLRRYIGKLHAETGWVVAVCNRRGHAGLPLTAPQVNTMGSTADFRRQLQAIEQTRPKAPLYGVGVSAGSALLVRYLGEEKERSRLRAGVALCPAYNIPDGFRATHPRYDTFLTKRLVRFFLEQNAATLRGIDGYEDCRAAGNLVEFHDRLYPIAGYRSAADFYEASDPMRVALETRMPVLVVNSSDDPVCVEANVRKNLPAMQTLERMTLVLTRYGSHCGYSDGLLARENWMARAVAEYLRAAHTLLGGDDAPRPSDQGLLRS